jgi:CRP-like cAMP-binding protein
MGVLQVRRSRCSASQAQSNALSAACNISYWSQLFKLRTTEQAGPGEILQNRRTSSTDMFRVARGIIKLIRTSGTGSEVVLSLRDPGQFVHYFSEDGGPSQEFVAMAVVSSEIYRIGVEQLRALEQQEPDIWRSLATMLSRDLHELVYRYIEMKTLPPADRLEQMLWRLAGMVGETISDGKIRLVLPLDNGAMAALCGVSESHYKAARAELEESGRAIRENRFRWVLGGH